MKRTFVCVSSCIKKYVQPSYGCCGTPVVARTRVYTARKKCLIHKCNYKKLLEQERKNEQKVGMLLQKRTYTRGVEISTVELSRNNWSAARFGPGDQFRRAITGPPAP